MNLSQPFLKLVSFMKESRIEARKVDWPTREQTIKSTAVVLTFSVAVAIFLSLFDLLFSNLLERFIL